MSFGAPFTRLSIARFVSSVRCRRCQHRDLISVNKSAASDATGETQRKTNCERGVGAERRMQFALSLSEPVLCDFKDNRRSDGK